MNIDTTLIRSALVGACTKMRPQELKRTPVIAVVAVGAAVTTIATVYDAMHGASWSFNVQITLWLWFTVYFANLAEAFAEGRGKAQAQSLRASRSMVMARRITSGREETINAAELRVGDSVVCEAGDTIPSDGEVIEGIASVNESAITGESAPVIRESGGDRSAVTGGTKVLSDRIVIRITAEQGNTFIDRIIGLVEGASRQRTPNEIALGNLLGGLTIVFLLVVGTLPLYTGYLTDLGLGHVDTSIPVLASLLVCLIPTTIGGLLSAIGISGMDRMIRRNVIATSGKAVEAAGDVNVLLLDKTGTITLGNRVASQFYPAPGISVEHLAHSSMLASLADDTPEGRSIVTMVKRDFGLGEAMGSGTYMNTIPFSAGTRMSGVDVQQDTGIISIRKGAVDSVFAYVQSLGGFVPHEIHVMANTVAAQGSTPLLVCEGKSVLGIVELRDVVKGGIRERFQQLRDMGIRTVMITGDNPLTAAAIAAEAGVDDFIAEAKPEDKLARIRKEQSEGRMVAMIGDGTNDAPALAQADVGVAMNSGTQAAREAGNMVDLDSNPTKLLEIVEIGKQLLITRGALTTFSIGNDVAKYFAILPAMFAGLYATSGDKGPLAALNVMQLHSAESAVLSAVIFNAIVIVALIPLAMRGISYTSSSTAALLRRNILLYGVGGIITPFLGIKIIDLLLTLFHLA